LPHRQGRLTLGIEATYNNCCLCILSSDREVIFEANECFKGTPPIPPGGEELIEFHRRTLRGMMASALEICSPDDLDFVSLSVVNGKHNVYVETVRPIIGEFADRHGLPVVPVDHTEAHLLACLITDPAPEFPFITLTASGGHSHLSVTRAVGDYAMIGSHDKSPRNSYNHGRAPGAVLDKCSELLAMVPPGQPDGAIAIDRIPRDDGMTSAFRFPLTEAANASNGYDFDFHHLYEEVDQALGGLDGDERQIARLAVSAQECVVGTLADKALSAARDLQIGRVAFGGGVAANTRLREIALGRSEREGIEVFFPPKELCGDNARMIAFAGLAKRADLLDG
jgi:N6-L-threonylcarbamoyladenine synthase